MAKQYTRTQWNQMQSRLPQEDRVPYEESPDKAPAYTPDAQDIRDPKTGLTPAQMAAQAALAEVSKTATAAGVANVVVPGAPGMAGRIDTPPTTGLKAGYEWYAFNLPGGGFEWRQRPTKDTLVEAYKTFGNTTTTTTTTTTNTATVTPTTTGLDPATQALIQSLQAQIASLTASQKQSQIDAAAAEAAAKKERTENAIAVLTDRFTKYGLASLVPTIKRLAIDGATEATITLQLQETDEYKQRFKANQERIKKGLSVLAPGDYLGLEDDYRQILRAYGLKQFDTDEYVSQFIANDISTPELSNRVVTAVQRVQNADPAILTTLRSYYGISDNDLVAYVLDPNQQFQKIERQVAAAEIGAAAGLQGIKAGVTVAEQLAAQGVTKAQAQKGYATIADILPTAEKLSDIYGEVLDEYRLGEAEQEVFNTLASAQRKRQKLTEREIAAFSGTSGLGKGALGSITGGNI